MMYSKLETDQIFNNCLSVYEVVRATMEFKELAKLDEVAVPVQVGLAAKQRVSQILD